MFSGVEVKPEKKYEFIYVYKTQQQQQDELYLGHIKNHSTLYTHTRMI